MRVGSFLSGLPVPSGVSFPALLLAAMTLALPATAGSAVAADPYQLARVIDEQLEAAQRAADIVPADNADDAEFLRRVTLDLAGRIPTVDEVTTFLNEPSPEKRSAVIDRLLDSDDHLEHFAKTWRALLLPETETNAQLRYMVPGFERWLREFRDANLPFDQFVEGLINVPITGTPERPQLVLTDLKAANPMAYLVAKDADPAKIAADVTRVFLGIRLECAQCHDHPFDTWTQEQFWNQAAFFAGIQRKGRGAFAPLFESADVHTISLMGKDREVAALFLDGHEPAFSPGEKPRVTFSAWVAKPENPYFSRAIVNRIWGQLMGTGLIDPVDDMSIANPASHPELLDALAAGWTTSQFDLDNLYRAICNSRAYQRTSRMTDPSQLEVRSYAKMAVKSLSGEQIYDSLELAVGWPQQQPQRSGMSGNSGRERSFLAIFGTGAPPGEPQTSVTQSLTLMNGSLVHSAVTPESSPLLKRLVNDTDLTTADRVEQIYLATFSRRPTHDELRTAVMHIDGGPSTDQTRRLGDILWVALNSAEFRWNH